mmetsp:Transcript_174168/g.552897  ORF Transcript_174168/g.552897 Transcript_174168/m.552897 type:complete len:263 (-) Transcript_174168:638-1426(-)
MQIDAPFVIDGAPIDSGDRLSIEVPFDEEASHGGVRRAGCGHGTSYRGHSELPLGVGLQKARLSFGRVYESPSGSWPQEQGAQARAHEQQLHRALGAAAVLGALCRARRRTCHGWRLDRGHLHGRHPQLYHPWRDGGHGFPVTREHRDHPPFAEGVGPLPQHGYGHAQPLRIGQAPAGVHYQAVEKGDGAGRLQERSGRRRPRPRAGDLRCLAHHHAEYQLRVRLGQRHHHAGPAGVAHRADRRGQVCPPHAARRRQAADEK